MAEIIKTVLEVEDRGHTAGMQRAATVLENYAAKVEQSRTKIRREFRGEMQALHHEAAGRKDAAQAIREKLSLQEQARKLAVQANIDEGMALRLLEKKLALEKQIAAEKVRPKAGLPELPLSPQYLSQMERAAFLKQNLARQTQVAGKAGQNGSMGFLAFSQAVEDAQYGIRGVLNNIPQMIMGFGGGMGLAGAISLAAVAAYSAYRVFDKLSGLKAMKAWEEGRTKGMKTYQKALEEGMEAVERLRREEVLSVQMTNTREAELERLRSEISYNKDAGDAIERKVKLLDIERRHQDALSKLRQDVKNGGASGGAKGDFEDAKSSYQNDRLRIMEDIRIKQEQINAAAAEHTKAWKGTGDAAAKYLTQMQTADNEIFELRNKIAQQEALVAQSDTQLEVDPDKMSVRLRQAEEEKNRQFKALLARNREDLAAAEERAELAAELLRQSKEMGAAAKEEASTRVAAGREEVEALKRAYKMREEIGRLEEAIIRARVKAAAREHKEQMDVLRARADGDKDLADQLQREIELRRETASLVRDVGLSEEEALKRAKERQDLERAVVENEKRKQVAAARERFLGEEAALRLELDGRKKAGEALRKDLGYRAEAVEMAERLGITESKALELLRRRGRMMEEIDRKEKGDGHGRRPGIRRADSDINAGHGRRVDAGHGRRVDAGHGRRIGDGLRHTRAAQNAERRRAGQAAANPEVRFWDKQIDLQEQLVKHLTKIGLV